MKKIEKLKEINETIKNICVDLETRIFVEDMDVVDKKIMKEYKPKNVEKK